MAETQYSFCRICESLCGLKITTENNKVLSIEPDEKHVATHGFGCPKGLKQHHIFNSPDRLKYPMKRVGKEWMRVSWEEANHDIGKKVKAIRSDYDPDAIAMYVGTAAGFSVLHPVFAQGFMDAVGSKSMYSSATQDCANKFAVAEHVYGFPFTQPFPDILHTNCLIIVGANPVVSKWSFLQVPNPSKHIKEMLARGASVYVVDPRKNETAKVAGNHVAIKPGTDAWFYLSFLNELIKQDGIKINAGNAHFEGVEEIISLAKEWPKEKTADITGINPDVLQEMVSTYSNANGAVLYSSTGVNMGGNGTIAFWLQEVINALSGNLDRKGGTLVGKGVIDFPKFGTKNGILMREDRSRIGNLKSVNDTFSGGILADEILTPGKKKVRGLFVTGGNPLITMANSNRMRKAFQELDLLVTLDIFPNETGSIAHFMLPCTSPLERPDLPFIFPLMLGLQAKPYLQATKAIIQPEFEQRDEATIYLDLCKASGINLFDSAIAQRFFNTMKAYHSRNKKGQPSLPQETLLSGLLRITGQGGYKSLLSKPHGKLREDHEPGNFLGMRVTTKNGKVNLAPAILMKQAELLNEKLKTVSNPTRRFKLITKRHVKTHNSWTHNYDEFVSGARNTNYLYMHPTDLTAIGAQEKQMVNVESNTGKVRLPVRALADLIQGTVALPHGWGHQSSRMAVASNTNGVNVNILSADGPDAIDPVSGMVHLTGVEVDVTPTDELQAKSWSGLVADELEV